MDLKYTQAQEEAVAHRDGNLLILACAGSGKTEVISRRIAELVVEGTKKSEIIAFTFTERAAGELKARIRRHLETRLPDDPSLGDMYVGTIHSFCLRILKEIDPTYRKFEVMDEARQAALLMTNFFIRTHSDRGIGLNRLRERTRTKRYWDTVRTFATTLSVLHQNSIPVASITDDVVRDAVIRYDRVAFGPPNYFFDFDRIIGALVDRLSTDVATLTALRARFKHLVVDEYQDVDDRQESLIRLLSDGGRALNVTVVGDDDQSIYGFRGARISNILRFTERYPNVRTVTIDLNFRSTHAIVEIANAAIRRLPDGSRTPKAMTARHWDSTGVARETMAAPGDVQARTFANEEEEAAWVAQRVEELRGAVIRERDGTERAIDYSDFAILLRSVRSAGRLFADALRARGIPVVVKGTAGLFEHDEVQLIYATFCLLARSQYYWEDETGTINRSDEADTRERIRNLIGQLRTRGQMPHAAAAPFLEWVARKREDLDRRNLEREERQRLGVRAARRIYPQDVYQEMLAALGMAHGPTPWPEATLYNLGRISQLITQFEAVHQWVTPKDLMSLCMFLGGWAAGEVDEGGVDEVAAPNAVQILTVHAAKGLEWPAVFLPRVSSANFPSSLRRRGPETFLDPSSFDPARYAVGDEGERRLWYVALTRCRRFLNITSPERPRKKPSEYFKEISHDSVQRDGPIPQVAHGEPTPAPDVSLLPTTFSDLSYYWRCNFEYQLRALMGFGPGVKESYGYGQQIHNILAEIHQRGAAGEEMSVDDVMRLVEQRFHLRYTRDGDVFKPLTMLREAAQKSLRRYLERFPETSRYVLASEKPFEFVDPESHALISGTIDLLEHVEHTPTGTKYTPVAVVDFKTHRFRDKQSFERSRAEVEAQLRLYAVAARSALGFDAQKAQAHFLTPKDVDPSLRRQGVEESFTVDISPQRQDEIRDRIGQTVVGIRASLGHGAFDLTGPHTGHCELCDYRGICPGLSRWKARNPAIPRPPSNEEARQGEIQRVAEDVDAWNET